MSCPIKLYEGIRMFHRYYIAPKVLLKMEFNATTKGATWKHNQVLLPGNKKKQNSLKTSHFRGVFKTLPKIWNEIYWCFQGYEKRSKAVNYFRKKLHLRCLSGFWIRLHFQLESYHDWLSKIFLQSSLS